ncbi:orotidine 5'-phosphate decarboxylase / HUMPS family protein [Ornithinimicrobium cavernae]|uniref:orotidine 5'-phosphate decarboxylase / HUMPS family protein n=1 Tax=Ornithinimicrobium cavernae TaxID=2666047 RepID=UPI000D69FD7F|nr:orotidine 5'-phosphate decarboxylase / HUMPS family protein [Ornithinimicrobium cavernae]
MSATAPLAVRRRSLQIALDVRTVPEALAALESTADDVDVIEVGTILCLSAGMEAVRCLRAAYPLHTILADVRIAEAGSLIANLAFDAGADWVSVVSGAAPATVPAVAQVAAARGKEVQVELSDGWDWDLVSRCREVGIAQFIVHRSRDAEASGNLAWSAADLDAIAELHRRGGRVSVTGGLKPEEIRAFSEIPAEIFIAGRGIYGAEDPAAAVHTYRTAIDSLPAVDR